MTMRSGRLHHGLMGPSAGGSGDGDDWMGDGGKGLSAGLGWLHDFRWGGDFLFLYLYQGLVMIYRKGDIQVGRVMTML